MINSGFTSGACSYVPPKLIGHSAPAVMFFRAWCEMQGGNLPSAAKYVEKFCEVNHLGEVFKEGALRVLAKMVTGGGRENSNARLAAIALHLYSIQAQQHKLKDAIGRMAQISPHVLLGLVKGAREITGLQVEKE